MFKYNKACDEFTMNIDKLNDQFTDDESKEESSTASLTCLTPCFKIRNSLSSESSSMSKYTERSASKSSLFLPKDRYTFVSEYKSMSERKPLNSSDLFRPMRKQRHSNLRGLINQINDSISQITSEKSTDDRVKLAVNTKPLEYRRKRLFSAESQRIDEAFSTNTTNENIVCYKNLCRKSLDKQSYLNCNENSTFMSNKNNSIPCGQLGAELSTKRSVTPPHRPQHMSNIEIYRLSVKPELLLNENEIKETRSLNVNKIFNL